MKYSKQMQNEAVKCKYMKNERMKLIVPQEAIATTAKKRNKNQFNLNEINESMQNYELFF